MSAGRCLASAREQGDVAPDDPRLHLAERVARLSADQALTLSLMVDAMETPVISTIAPTTDFATQPFVDSMADALRIHHVVSAESFTKDKSEHALVAALTRAGHVAELAPRGNPGYDLTVDDARWSLKTEASANIRRDSLHISKFMELGRGAWVTEADLAGLRQRMFDHMTSYDRILSLRCISARRGSPAHEREYELVEIPKALVLESANYPCLMQHDSTQTPKPGRCVVPDPATGRPKFELYFDGGTERKLQVRSIEKTLCTVRATWKFRT